MAKPNFVVGVIIESEIRGDYLHSDGKTWDTLDRPEDACVHPPSILNALQGQVRAWRFRPAKVYPAVWRKGRGTRVFYDEAFDFKW